MKIKFRKQKILPIKELLNPFRLSKYKNYIRQAFNKSLKKNNESTSKTKLMAIEVRHYINNESRN